MDIKIDGRKVVVTFNLQEPRPSSSGKSDLLYSTGGFVPINGTDMRINLTVIKPRRGRG